MIVFSNSGEIDHRVISTFGVNVKPQSGSPIGQFGTGLKYAIAGALRLGATVTIHSGLTTYAFSVRADTIRGKEFSIVCMAEDQGDPFPIGFTLELGKKWEPWMIYREFYCNMLDEGGAVGAAQPSPQAGQTHILIVGSAELETVHEERAQYFLDAAIPRSMTSPDLEALPGASPHVYYRGIRVATFDKPWSHTYNILAGQQLTEDRTLDRYYAKAAITRGLARSTDSALATRVLTIKGDSHAEGEIDWSSHLSWCGPSEQFLGALKELVQSRRVDLSDSARQWVKSAHPELLPPAIQRLTAIQASALSKARKCCAALGHPIEAPVIVTAELGHGVLGMALEGKIYISLEAFRQGTKIVAGTLLEEHLHIAHGVEDGRAMQNLLLNLLIGQAEERLGEAL